MRHGLLGNVEEDLPRDEDTWKQCRLCVNGGHKHGVPYCALRPHDGETDEQRSVAAWLRLPVVTTTCPSFVEDK